MREDLRLTVEERGALLRASRTAIDRLNEEIIRLHELNGREGAHNRKLADVEAAELVNLASAVRKLWVASGGASP